MGRTKKNSEHEKLGPVRREFQGQRELIQGVPRADYCPHSVDLTATWLSSSDARGPYL